MIYVIEDDKAYAELILEAIQLLGHPIQHLASGSEVAAQTFEDNDLLILDLAMPDVDGIDVIRTLGNGKKKVSVIFISGMDWAVLESAKVIAENKEIKVRGLLQKPFRIIEITKLVSECLGDSVHA